MNIDRLRNETPGTQNVIHFNNAGASLMPRQVSQAVISYIREEEAYGGYETAYKRKNELNETYQSIARFIGAESDEIALLENATAAWNMAFFSVDFRNGDRILTSVSEYASNYINYLRLQQEIDVQIDVIPNDEYGQTSVDALKELIDDDVKLISITHIPTNSGLVNPIEDIGQVAKKYNCLYLVDACQSMGHYPVDVQKIGCDMLSGTGRKYLRGPRGTGFLYVKKDTLPKLTPPFLDLHAAEWTSQNSFKMRDDARRFENWEFNYADVSGLKTAVEYADRIGIENIWNRITYLADYFRTELDKIPYITVQDIGKTKCGIVTFSVDSMSPSTVREKLWEHDINVHTATKSSTLLDMQKRNLEEVVRASLHYFNTEDEIEKFAELLKSLPLR